MVTGWVALGRPVGSDRLVPDGETNFAAWRNDLTVTGICRMVAGEFRSSPGAIEEKGLSELFANTVPLGLPMASNRFVT